MERAISIHNLLKWYFVQSDFLILIIISGAGVTLNSSLNYHSCCFGVFRVTSNLLEYFHFILSQTSTPLHFSDSFICQGLWLDQDFKSKQMIGIWGMMLCYRFNYSKVYKALRIISISTSYLYLSVCFRVITQNAKARNKWAADSWVCGFF